MDSSQLKEFIESKQAKIELSVKYSKDNISSLESI